MSKFTVFGGRGFIGSAFVKDLKTQGHDVFVPEREDLSIFEENLGTIIYSAGYGDCQKDPFNVLHANITLLSSLLEKARFNKLVYISSTRVYMNQYDSSESCDLKVSYDDDRRLFNLTKLVSEELCLKSNRDCLIIRPSNVYGLAKNSPLFLPSIVRSAITNGSINMYVTRDYSKDYVFVGDVVRYTLDLLNKNAQGLFNLASGTNTSAKEIADIIVDKTGCNVNWLVEEDIDFFHEIDITKVVNTLDYKPNNVIDDLKKMIEDFENFFKKHKG
ncbi:NAD(P)-dependent oxidoreductase [Vibrio sp. Of14-4]|uniref:NAD-dependent epimerase/dehydratase family protein n=1 Tax=Vibrio sp. Of14-4 TaxID=2724878 RepID=UPI001EF22CFA|nr:NAD(P)-dependent oxidoreductase [Vibrio sp. Of14-4]MCG7489690.1 NAD(P)-dependent oxidoreductase [Vibrio sp. Of14-4]